MHCFNIKHGPIALRVYAMNTAGHVTSAMRTFVAALVGCCLVICLLKAALQASLHTEKAGDSTESANTSLGSLPEATNTCCTCLVLSRVCQKPLATRTGAGFDRLAFTYTLIGHTKEEQANLLT